jgi:hypothetical protein
MKRLILIMMLASAASAYSQKISLKEGKFNSLQGEKSIKLQFVYDDMIVGDLPEKDYIAKKKEELNLKEPGRGADWEKRWYGDRKERFEPKFIELFTKYAKLTLNEDAKYTMIIKTTRTEPGWVAAGMIRSDAKVDADVLIVETANPKNVIIKMQVKDSPGRGGMGYDYDSGLRIQEAYAKAGKDLGKIIHDKIH